MGNVRNLVIKLVILEEAYVVRAYVTPLQGLGDWEDLVPRAAHPCGPLALGWYVMPRWGFVVLQFAPPTGTIGSRNKAKKFSVPRRSLNPEK